MIPETMNLEALLEKTTDAGLLRDMSAHPQSCRLRVSSPALGPDISKGISRDDRIMLAGIALTSTVHLLLTACLPLPASRLGAVCSLAPARSQEVRGGVIFAMRSRNRRRPSRNRVEVD